MYKEFSIYKKTREIEEECGHKIDWVTRRMRGGFSAMYGKPSSRQEAEEIINKWFGPYAAVYYYVPLAPEIQEAQKRARAAYDKVYEEYESLLHSFLEKADKKTSIFIGCHDCGSKIRREQLSNSASLEIKFKCPVCGSLLLSKRETETLNKARDLASAAWKEVEATEVRQECRWLIKIA